MVKKSGLKISHNPYPEIVREVGIKSGCEALVLVNEVKTAEKENSAPLRIVHYVQK